jgi:GNAT superfamily N-acetyltransferase
MSWEIALAGGYGLSDDKARLDLETLLRFFREESYWGRDRTRAQMEQAVAHCLCVGLYAPDASQAGFARVISDFTFRAHLADVVVLAPHRGRGLGKAMVGAVLEHPALRDIRTWTLGTQDAQGLYARFGFGPPDHPERQMTLRRPGLS